jgi:hypothetical protein
MVIRSAFIEQWIREATPKEEEENELADLKEG